MKTWVVTQVCTGEWAIRWRVQAETVEEAKSKVENYDGCEEISTSINSIEHTEIDDAYETTTPG